MGKVISIKEPLRVAVVGCGEISQRHHIPSLPKMRNVKLVALCDSKEGIVTEAARKFNIDRYYTDFSAMLNSEVLDMVDICTSPQSHLPLSLKAIEAGCHVIVEKPIALTVKEFDEMANAAKRNSVKLCTIHNKLFETVMVRAQAIVNMGYIGGLTGIDIQVLHSQQRAERILMDKTHWCHTLPAGILTEVLPHPIYLAQAFLGRAELVALCGRKSGKYDWVVADEVSAILKSEKGMGTFSFSARSAQSKTIIDIHGTKRHLRVDLLNSVMLEYGYGTGTLFSRALENLDQSFSIFASTVASTVSVASGKFHTGHYNLFQRFVESIEKDLEPPITLAEARDVIVMLEKIATLI